MSEFGLKLSMYRRNAQDPKRGGPLTQSRFVELLEEVDAQLVYTPPTVSRWETGDRKISPDNRLLLIAIIQVLLNCNGMRTIEDGNDLLSAGYYMDLDLAEIAQLDISSENSPSDSESQKERKADDQFRINIEKLIAQAEGYALGALHQLRGIPRSFKGREAEIKQIFKMLSRTQERTTITISGIEGMPGIGKTELANVAAHYLKNDYPDAQLLIELGANTPRPLSAERARDRVLNAFDLTLRTSDFDDATLWAMYRAKLNEKRTLLIFDDVRDDAHVKPLLGFGINSAALITSRRALSVGERILLQVLSHTDAHAVLRVLCPRLSDEDLEVIRHLCGNLPIALSMAGSFMRRNPRKPPEEYIADVQRLGATRRLKDERGVPLEAIFQTSFQQLSVLAQAGLLALTVMPTSFDRSAALSVIGDDTADTFDDIDNLNMLLFSEHEKRYRWHDLVREFALNKKLLQTSKLARALIQGDQKGSL